MKAMRIVLWLILALALAGAATFKKADRDPVSLLTAIYESYQNNDPQESYVYSKRLQVLVDRDEKEAEGMVGRIGWDVFIDGQDWQLSELKIVVVSKSATHAVLRATFKNFDHPCNMLFDLILGDGHWRINDIQKTLKPRWTMSKILLDAPDAFPDAEPETTPKTN